MSIRLINRAALPYPPALPKVNGALPPIGSTAGDALVTWEFINPEIRGGRIFSPFAGGDPVTPGTTFTVEVYVGGVLKRTVTKLTALSYLYTVAMRLADSTNASLFVQFRVYVVRGANTSAASVTDAFLMASAAVPVTITNASPLPGAVSGQGYSVVLNATGGAGAPYTYTQAGGSIPPGFALANGVLSGVCTIPNTYSFTLQAASPVGVSGTKAFSITVT